MKSSIVTITRHLVDQEKEVLGATGEFTRLLWDLTIAFKQISRELNMAGLAELLGITGDRNVHGESVKKLDLYAHETIFKAMDHGGHLCLMASEEDPEVIVIPERFRKGRYILLYDPLDGSSNLEVNVSVGTVFSILRKDSPGTDGRLEDCLQPGVRQIAAGYVVYGSSTMMVYTTGRGVYGFTLDPGIGEFLLSHPEIRIPSRGSVYSINEGNEKSWDEATRRYVRHLKDPSAGEGHPYSLRYTGSLVSDVHRTLLLGGIFLYPAHFDSSGRPTPKLRLLYEANPIGMIAEQAGGRAITGKERVLEVEPSTLHQRVPVVVGSPLDVNDYERFVRESG